MDYWVLAYYTIVPLDDPDQELARQKDFFSSREMTGRIYISCEGINAQLSGKKADIEEYIEWLKKDARFANTAFKVQDYPQNAFPRMTVKTRSTLVALGQPVDLSKRGTPTPPSKWREMLENKDEKVILDVRNDYEWDVGHFEGAERPDCKTFRDFPKQAEQLAARHDPKTTKVMMYCTGGIRCEFYSSLLKEKGFEEVYQLDGGVIQYAEEEGGEHWKGKLFVFDDRLTVDIDGDGITSVCHSCGEPTDAIYNCANMDCNKLFTCCEHCLEELAGCCQSSCQEGPRVRPLDHQVTHRPFRKWYNYFSGKQPSRR